MTLAGLHGPGLMWGEDILVMDPRTQGEYCFKIENINSMIVIRQDALYYAC